MIKKDDIDSDEGSTESIYTINDVLRQGFKIEGQVGGAVEELIDRLGDNCDYMKGILCMVVAMEILKPNGFRIHVKEHQDGQVDAYFSRTDDKVILFANENMYMALMDQLIYKTLTTIGISGSERRYIMNVLDTIKEATRTHYEDLTQIEIKMLEWLDIKLIDLIDKLLNDKDDYVTDLEYMDESVVNLVGVYLMWGRNLERMELVHKILSPLIECIQNTILTKIENYIISNQVFGRIKISDYFSIKLNTIRLLDKENIPYEKKLDIVKDVRELHIPIQTKKTLDEFKIDIEKFGNIDGISKECEKEKSIYRCSVQQRSDELNYIYKMKKELSKNRKINGETIVQLTNLEDIIESEEQDLEESLRIIDEKINILKGAGM